MMNKGLLASCLLARCLPAAGGVSAVYDANNTLLGEFAEPGVVHSPMGYRFKVDGLVSGEVTVIQDDVGGATFVTDQLYFPQFGCNGQAYVVGGANSAGGLVFSAGTRGLYSLAKSPVRLELLAVASYWQYNTCYSTMPGSLINGFAVEPNDPATTGVHNTPYLLPLRLEIVPLSQFLPFIFRNGFESSYLGAHEPGQEQRYA